MRVAAYCRVSTGRQADGDLSLPDQQRQVEAYCRRKGWQVVRTFVEAGASARDDERPVFRQMIAEATGSQHPFDCIVVHSLSRFFRDEALGELYVRRLRKHKVLLQSVTQEIGSDPLSDLARRVVGLLDEHTSKETAKHTLRSMEENARQGFWNGSRPPIGYRVVEAGMKGARMKKRLDIHTGEAEIVRRIFRLYGEGENGSGPLGLKAIVNHLNKEGLQIRGRRLSLQPTHLILSRETYVGRHYFNTTDSRTGQRKPRCDWIEVAVPAIIDAKTFAAVQNRLRSRDPRKTPAGVSGSPYLLTGLVRCGYCGSAMTMASGKSGRYRYYKCSTLLRVGKTGCRGQIVPVGKLDASVIELVQKNVLKTEFLSGILSAHRERLNSGAASNRELAEAERAASDAAAAVDRLFEMVATGVLPAQDPDLKRHLETAVAGRDQARRRLLDIRDASATSLPQPTDRQIRELVKNLRRKIGDQSTPEQKHVLRLLLDRIELQGDTLKFIGNARKLAHMAANVDESGVIGSKAFLRSQTA